MQFATIESHPLFFDSLFPSFQSTTPETVVSDYRQRKRVDSRAEHEVGHDGYSSGVEMKVNGENNVEFYAEVIGKLVGTIRDGVSSFIGELRQRKHLKPDESEMTIEKLKNQQFKHANSDMNAMGMHQAFNETRIQKSNESTLAPTEKTSTTDSEMFRESQEIKQTTKIARRDDSSESNDDERENSEIGSQTEPSSIAWSNVVQVIARRTKRKRSEESNHRTDEDDEGMNAEQLEIPIDSDGEMTNERVTTGNGDGDDADEQEDIELTNDVASWYEKHQNLFSNLSAKHRRRKEKLINFIHRFTKSNSPNNATSSDSKLSFAIMRGNSTIVHLTPLQFLRTFHRGSDEHTELQQKTKTTLQKAFYKYARIYLFARKGYKDARSFNRKVQEFNRNQENEDPQPLPSSLPLDQSPSSSPLDETEKDESLTFIEEDDSESFAANSARTNLQAVETFAILILEIFGAMLGIALGAIAQIEANNLFEI